MLRFCRAPKKDGVPIKRLPSDSATTPRERCGAVITSQDTQEVICGVHYKWMDRAAWADYTHLLFWLIDHGGRLRAAVGGC